MHETSPVKLEFSKEVSEKLRLIAFMEYDNQINIDKKHETHHKQVVRLCVSKLFFDAVTAGGRAHVT